MKTLLIKNCRRYDAPQDASEISVLMKNGKIESGSLRFIDRSKVTDPAVHELGDIRIRDEQLANPPPRLVEAVTRGDSHRF